MDDDLLLRTLNDLDPGTLACVIQMAWENEGTLSERLGKGYYEMVNGDDDPDAQIRLK